ncbi:SusC/RagA family TonB-linked outer membrane protein [Pseudobacter ginsenosidimutans]|uniref:TonB-linked SusC/RagA family outer membrane protein n=1 Tax=Pseudobacter ginsenosidimutans TaxID=661488 RepID=A0A4Q7N4K4_9BACT|nr:SusC/RagA family TonB-linked outer membrane protein [Pseudobacter ginsenosidimutans]QEC44459.1 SusC/RagA family TonB-linked outer membrane protein [Pseudobacter ginsenosidimutans]RZS75931.1 TonB-linked SusC/RagA family outer membrane protein [Pseudobacter ginsenosidimutans]
MRIKFLIREVYARPLYRWLLLPHLMLLLCLFHPAHAQVPPAPANQLVTLKIENASIEEVLKKLRKVVKLQFIIDAGVSGKSKSAPFNLVDVPLSEVLDKMLVNTGLEYVINKSVVIIRKKAGAQVQPGTSEEVSLMPVTVIVKNEEGDPLQGATVADAADFSNVRITDANGQALLPMLPASKLLISYVGFDSRAMPVGGRKTVIVALSRANAVLEDAVVYNGYQKIKQKYLTGAVTSLKMDSIIQPGLTTVDKMLEGRVPGLMFMQNSGQSGAAPKLRIRGTSTYLGSREPLWVVDGIVRTNPFPIPAERINDPDFVNLLGNAISGLNPYDIEQVDVLKDATATALYGVRAANGVIVITTKRGKPGPPTVFYNITGTYTRRPRYTDRSVYMMDSRERVDVSREMIEKELPLRGGALEAYEKDIVDYYSGRIDYETFKKSVDRAEAINTDWMGHTMRDVFATSHTLSVSGGNNSVFYRASVGYNNAPGVIKKESNDRYTGILNLQMNYRKFKVDFNIQLSKLKKRYTPAEVGLLNYVYGTSRAIPLYNEDGSRYFYSTVGYSLFGDFKTMNILNEMDHTGQRIESFEYTAGIDLNYEIAKGIQFRSTLAYSGGNSSEDAWFEENTEWATQLRYSAFNPLLNIIDPNRDPMPFGGQLRGQQVRNQNYSINGRLHFSRFLDQQSKHLLTVEAATELRSLRANSTTLTSRGYYPGRGHSFAQVDVTKYLLYASWLSTNGFPLITESIQNFVRPYLTANYVFNDRYIISATASQEFSNSFGTRSNEKFLPTWALSGRWNLHEDLLRNVSWVNMAALRVGFGTSGNMLEGQTPYTIIQKGNVNTTYDAFSATTVFFPNPDLAWEKTQDYNGSLEFTLLKGRITGSLGYFYRKTTNTFLKKKVSAVNGAPGNNYVVNGGTLENQGVELSLNFKLIDNMGAGKKRFLWRFDPQLGQVFNKLINDNLNSRNVMVDAATLTYQDFLDGKVPVNGKSVNTFYSYRFKGLDPQYGFPVFYGAEPENKDELFAQYNKMTKDQVFSMVMVESGRREPVLQGGISNTFIYGNWTLNVMFSYSVGSKIRLLQIASGNYGTFRPSSQQNLRKEFTNRWRYPGDEKFTNIPAIQGASNIENDQIAWWAIQNLTSSFATDYYQMYDFSDLRVVKGDYLKLQYVSLGYRFSNELCRKLSCKGADITVSGSNLYTFANKALRGQDPSQSGSAPNIGLSIRPVYALTLNISF